MIDSIIKEGHFKLRSGKHSNKYINKDELFFNLPAMYKVMSEIRELVFSFPEKNLITGPAMAGAILASNVAFHFRMPYVYPDKKGDDMVFRKCFHDVIKGKKVLIIEDIITTGSSVIKTANAIEELGGYVSGVLCICNRGNWNPNKLIVKSVLNIELETWDAECCPLCKHTEAIDPKISL
jgi:orotate phosphoribosyltransferase